MVEIGRFDVRVFKYFVTKGENMGVNQQRIVFLLRKSRTAVAIREGSREKQTNMARAMRYGYAGKKTMRQEQPAPHDLGV